MSAAYQQITSAEKEALKLLQGVTFPVGAPQKRFVRDTAGKESLTEKQRQWIPILVWRYRKQIGPNRAARIIKEMEIAQEVKEHGLAEETPIDASGKTPA